MRGGENSRPSRGVLCFFRGRIGPVRSDRLVREDHTNRQSSRTAVDEPDVAAVATNDFTGNREAEAEPSATADIARAVAFEERFKHPFLKLGGDAGTVIGHVDLNGAVV